MSEFITEQAEEIEVLASIFPSELVVESSEPGNSRFSLRLSGEPSDPASSHVIASLCVSFPPAYPSVSPVLSIVPEKGLSKAQADELQELADKLAVENVGMQCVFVIAEGIKEWLQDNNVPGQDGSMYADMLRRMQQKNVETKKKEEKAAIIAAAEADLIMSGDHTAVDKEEEERIRRRQAGTAVTVETFLSWKAAFDEEQRLLSMQQGKEILKDDRPTGKQLFLSNKAKNDEDEGGAEPGELDFGDLADYEGLIDDDVDDEDYNPDEDGDDEDEDDDYDGED